MNIKYDVLNGILDDCKAILAAMRRYTDNNVAAYAFASNKKSFYIAYKWAFETLFNYKRLICLIAWHLKKNGVPEEAINEIVGMLKNWGYYRG